MELLLSVNKASKLEPHQCGGLKGTLLLIIPQLHWINRIITACFTGLLMRVVGNAQALDPLAEIGCL